MVLAAERLCQHGTGFLCQVLGLLFVLPLLGSFRQRLLAKPSSEKVRLSFLQSCSSCFNFVSPLFTQGVDQLAVADRILNTGYSSCHSASGNLPGSILCSLWNSHQGRHSRLHDDQRISSLLGRLVKHYLYFLITIFICRLEIVLKVLYSTFPWINTILLLQVGSSFVEFQCRLPVEEELIGRWKLLVTRKWIV